MRFSCEGCSAKYMISDDKVGPAGVKVRCKKCGHVTLVRRGEPEGAPAPGGRAGRRVVGGHRRAARGTGGDRGAPAPLGPGRDRPGEPGLVLGARRVGAPLVGARAALPPRRRHAGGPSRGGPSAPPASGAFSRRPRRPTTSGAPERPPRWPRWRSRSRGTWTSRPASPPARSDAQPAAAPTPTESPASGPTPPGSCPCPWPGSSGPGRSASPPRRGREASGPGSAPGAHGEPLAHRGPAGGAGGRGGRGRRPLVDDEVAGPPAWTWPTRRCSASS